MRYENDFEEIEKIGQGGFGSVFKARHRIDHNIYAIKKVKLKKDKRENERIRREITYLANLNNVHIVRYFQTWVETETDPEKVRECFGSSDEYDSEEEDEIEEDSYASETIKSEEQPTLKRQQSKKVDTAKSI
jgi:eukaryotic translation initiation factor 2-alpha kinase 4